MYEEKKMFYHALNVACIDVLDCDIPLDIGFNIQNYVNTPDYRYRFRGYFGRHLSYALLSQRPKRTFSVHGVNKHHKAKTPKHLKSNSGAGYR